MEDQLTGKTEVDVTIEEVVSTQVQEVLTAQAVVPGSIMDFSSQVGEGMDSLKIPRFGNFVVQDKNENQEVDAQKNAFAADTLNLDQYKVVQFLIEDIANIQSKVALQEEYVNQAGKDLAADMDLRIIDEIKDNVSSSTPDHIFSFKSGTDLSEGDIIEARRLLNLASVPMAERFCLISPDNEADLLNIDKFVRVDEAGASDALRNGEIGKLFGFRFLSSEQVPADETVFYHRSTAVMARQLEPKVEMQRNIKALSDHWSISHIFGRKMLDSGKRAVKVTA